MDAPITAFYAAIFAIALVYFSVRVILLRRKRWVDMGDEGHPDLQRAIRVQANFAEYIPFATVLLLLVELNGAQTWLLHGFGITLIIARALHFWGFGFHRGTSFGRFTGTTLTFFSLIALAIVLAVLKL